MNEPPQEFIEKAWNEIAELHDIHREERWTQGELYALFETAVRIGWGRGD